jgi:2-methylisocitrate lyase-like PEP mutase family enzyme
MTQKEKAGTLLSLHTSGKLLVLPNIWNPIGARILQAKGFPAVATASAAVSASLGYVDGERINRSTLIDIVTRIARSVDVPVTADIESGYAETTTALKETIHAVIESGVVGINLEDGREHGAVLRTIAEQCERIGAAREAAEQHGVHLVINARVDTFLSGSFPSRAETIEEAVTRARAYAEAGADCIYPIGPGDRETVATLRHRISAPINILASADAAPLPILQSLGVNRVSFGPFIFRSCMRKFVQIAGALHKFEGYECFSASMMSAEEMAEFLVHDRE